MFAIHEGSNHIYPIVGKVYNFDIFENDVKVRHFVPSYRKIDNVVGMYDTVNGVFYTNAGTGSFTKGSNIT